jgi:hypothetical protein
LIVGLEPAEEVVVVVASAAAEEVVVVEFVAGLQKLETAAQ